jgi:xylose isomerase
MSQPKFAVGLWVLGQCGDRFCRTGYGPVISVEEQIHIAGALDGVTGVECHGSDFDEITVDKYVGLVGEQKLVTTNVNTNVWGVAQYGLGGFTHGDPKVRQAAIDEGKRSCELARQINSPSVALWLGADGFDYPWQTDYVRHLDLLVDGIRAVAEEASPDLKVGVEYKLKEPRTHMTISTAGTALVIVQEVAMDNVGCTVDYGHALMAQEDPGLSVALLQRYGKLFNVHFNDAWGAWDDDMIVGSVNPNLTLEFLYYCRKTGYDGWYGLDMFPYREDGGAAAQLALDNLRALWAKLDEIDEPALAAAQATLSAVETQKVIGKVWYG